MSDNRIPYHVRIIDNDIQITPEILDREEQAGYFYMSKECERLNKFVYTDVTRFSFMSYRKDERTIEFYLQVEHPNEEGSWV